MRILLDTTFARRGPSGTAVYLHELQPALEALGVEVVAACNERRASPAGGGPRSWANLTVDRWWTQVELPRRARAVRADVLHHPLPAHSARAPCPQVISVHDLAPERLPECFDRRFRAFARRTYPAAARRAGAVVCVSETTARDVAARWGVARERIAVAHHGPGQSLPDPVAATAPPYFLYVGDDEPRKNVALLLAAHRLYREAVEEPLTLVLAGSVRAARPGVRVEKAPDRERLAALYAGAAALVHPSLQEGFGLTPLEAMAAGTPVLAARSDGLVETCADAARLFDPRDAAALAGALAEVAADEALRAQLSRRGRKRAQEFSWERSARAHVQAYTLAARSHE